MILFRFRIIQVKKSEGKNLATVEIFTDEVPKSITTDQRRTYLDNLKRELKVYYDCKMKNIEADQAKEKLDPETSLNKIVFRGIDEIELPYLEKIKFLQLMRVEDRIEMIMKIINEKT